MLNERHLPLAGLFLLFSLLLNPLSSFTITSSGRGFILEASAQEIAGKEDEGEPASSEATYKQLSSLLPMTPLEDSPNILLIISDDQPFYTAKYTPIIVNEIFAKGINFTDALLSTSLCCPSRASILTGLYAHNHGVLSNPVSLTNTTFFQAIDAAEENLSYYYRTAMIGKYLNSDSGECRNNDEFDYWVAFVGRRAWYNGTDKRLNVNCEWMSFTNTYSTYLLRDYAIEFLNSTINEGKHFVMWFSPYSPHSRGPPAPEDANLYPNGLPSYYLPPSFLEEDISDKPAWMKIPDKKGVPLSCREEDNNVSTSSTTISLAECKEAYKERQLMIARTLASFDRSVGKLLDFLESKGELSNTLIIYINDNGIHNGEHRLFNQKNTHYKEAAKAIMGIRWDDYTTTHNIPVGQEIDELVGNIDIAPTIYDALGLTPPYPLDGRSLLDLLLWSRGINDSNTSSFSSSSSWRQSFLLEHWNIELAPFTLSPIPGRNDTFIITEKDATVVTKEWTYTETKGEGNKPELYNRNDDPYELNNLWCSPEYILCPYAERINELAAELRALRTSWDKSNKEDDEAQCPCYFSSLPSPKNKKVLLAHPVGD